jgi:glucose/arabinose dehydrogenase
VRFSQDGRVFVAEKSGLVKVFDSLTDPTPSTFADLNVNVHNYWDRGLLGLALDPNFPASPYVYVLYTHDAAIGGQAPRWGTPGVLSDACPDPTGQGCVVSGRVSRLTASGNTASGPEQVLVEGWCQQFPSHSVGALAFGPDGALYVSGGEGANFNVADYGQNGNPCGDPPGAAGTSLTLPNAEGGALRSQDLRTRSDAVGYNGSLLRIDPSTGAAFAGNPLSGDPDANARRVVAHGFRNPFRFAIKPGTNEVWVADVGWDESEEIDVVTPGQLLNFGWPCYEGNVRQSAYDGLNLSLCETLYGTAGAVTQPHFVYRDGQPAFPGDTCSPAGGTSLSGIAFYAGGAYPSRYAGALFFSDYSRRCIWVLIDGSAAKPEAFATAASGPVDLQVGPGGDLFYVDIEAGAVRRIRYTTPGPPQTGTSYVSDLAWVTSSNGWGPVERDRSNGELGGGDGRPLTVAGTVYAKGLGAHAVSDVVISLGGSCSSFRATVGVDDEVGSLGAVQFHVYGDDVRLWQSPVVTGSSAGVPVNVDVSGRSTLRLSITDGGDGLNYDHADWADARVVCGSVDAAPTVSAVSPAAGAAGVPAPARPAATFSEPMTASSVTSSTFKLRRQGAQTDVAASVAYDATARTATLTPSAALDAGASYTATVVGGASGVKDSGGTPLAADYTWTFTVAAGANTAPRPAIDTPAAGLRWSVGETVSFSGAAADDEDGPLGAARLAWALILHHCGDAGCHAHPIQSFDGVASGSFIAPDHEYPSHLELRLTATDSGGLTAVASRLLDPRTVELSFASTPSGLDLVVGSAAASTPFTRTVIVGSQNSLSAPSPQARNGQSYAFSSWSDGGAQAHTVTAPSANATYTATYTESSSPPTITYVGDMPWISSSNGWGPVERNGSNGESGAGDGRPLTLNGVVFAKGLGAHAASEVAVSLGGCSRFQATVGVDDEVGSLGSVKFQVVGDGVVLWESVVLTGSMASVPVDVDVSGRSTLRLLISNGGDNINFDHADWADAQLHCGPDQVAPTVSSVSPAAGAIGVAASVRPVATFSEPMASASVTASTFVLRRQGAASDVAASVTYDAGTRTATLTPAAPLEGGASYTARVVGGPAGVKDVAGNALATDHAWTFTVATVAPGPIRAFPSSIVLQAGTYLGGNIASLTANDGDHYRVNSTPSGTRTTSWNGVVTGVPNTLASLAVSYRGANSASCSQTVSVWRWTTGAWVTLDTATIGTTETSRFGLVPPGPVADYVSGTTGNGEVHVRIRCTRSANFTARGEQLFIDYSP